MTNKLEYIILITDKKIDKEKGVKLVFNSRLLKETRQQKGYTLLTLSEAIKENCKYNIDPRTISSWENNTNSNPRKTALLAVCKVLELQPADLHIDNMVDSEDINILVMIEKIISIYKKDKKDLRIKQIYDILK